ncbi:MAG TPA: aminopeptidase P family protein [Rhodanobacteraceae bacterium]|nr:aminopeptidase P family protein [Rhodanobacteraceae bacterium]
MNTLSTPEHRFAALRDAMRAHGVNACLVPSADPHLSEYLPGHWQARQWLSGFSGSAGTLVVTNDFAGLWTDSRYFEQAAQQLAGSGITLMRLRVPHMPEHVEWLVEHLAAGQTLAVAGDCISLGARSTLQGRLAAHGARLRCDLDLPGEIWRERPPLPTAPVFEHAIDDAIVSRTEKLRRVRDAMREASASHHLLSTLDDIGWLTNLRGSDVEYNPVFLAHLLVDGDRATLFVGNGKIGSALAARLEDDGFAIAPYGALAEALASIPDEAKLLLDPAQVVSASVASVPEAVDIVAGPAPSTLMKAVKGPREIERVREVMRRDGAALVHGMRQVLERVAAGTPTSELDVATLLHAARAAQPGFQGESFATIAGYQANGALPHYQATPDHHAMLEPRGLLLVDSGGQYLGGTTDITRMWPLGELGSEQRRDVTLVLKGMIDLSRARFPSGASGPQLDALARAPLWAAGADYGHGTGHGVGYFLNVHEGPHGIRPPAPGGALVPLQPGMISSIEPGLYKAGRHGVRHENLAVVQAVEQTEFGDFLGFDTLTLCPIDTRAIDPDLLDAAQREWLDAYHARVESELAPLLDDPADRGWLAERCQPLAMAAATQAAA